VPNQDVACVADSAETETFPPVGRFAEADPASAVTTPSTAVRAYLRMFRCVAVYVSDGDRVSVSLDPFTPKHPPIAAVWWVNSAPAALAIREECEAEESSDVVTIAAGLHIALTTNAQAITNAERAIARMNVLVDQAQQQGLMRCLNARYRQERMRTRDQGRSFPPYAIIHKRFVQSLLRIASGEVPQRSLVEIALGITHEATQPDSRGRL
jgi:hypothetical protein